MEVLLRQDVDKLGAMGEVVDVATGYARNYLIPRKLAVAVTAANLDEVRRAREAKLQRDSEEMQRVKELCQSIEGFLCLVKARATEEGHLFGSVTAEIVAEALVESGFKTVRPANIVMQRHLEQLGDYELEVMLHPDARAHITVRVAPLEEEEKSEGQS